VWGFKKRRGRRREKSEKILEEGSENLGKAKNLFQKNLRNKM
jgi:hypothetical protein